MRAWRNGRISRTRTSPTRCSLANGKDRHHHSILLFLLCLVLGLFLVILVMCQNGIIFIIIIFFVVVLVLGSSSGCFGNMSIDAALSLMFFLLLFDVSYAP